MTSIDSGSKVLRATQQDVQKMLAAHIHLGTKNTCHMMKKYVHGRTKDGINIIDMHTTWEKLMLAARIIVSVENPVDVCVCSVRLFGQRATLKYAQNTGANYITGRFIPGSFTNQIQSKFTQPRVLIVTDPRTDHQALNEARLVNIPVIALADTDSPLSYVDVAIPCNNRGKHAIGMMYWLLAREVLRMRGAISRAIPWEVKVDLFFYRDPEEAEKNEAEAADNYGASWQAADTSAEAAPAQQDWNAPAADWNAQQAAAAPAAAGQDWNAQAAAGGDNWGAVEAAPAAASGEWGGAQADQWGSSAPAAGQAAPSWN